MIDGHTKTRVSGMVDRSADGVEHEREKVGKHETNMLWEARKSRGGCMHTRYNYFRAFLFSRFPVPNFHLGISGMPGTRVFVFSRAGCPTIQNPRIRLNRTHSAVKFRGFFGCANEVL